MRTIQELLRSHDLANFLMSFIGKFNNHFAVPWSYTPYLDNFRGGSSLRNTQNIIQGWLVACRLLTRACRYFMTSNRCIGSNWIRLWRNGPYFLKIRANDWPKQTIFWGDTSEEKPQSSWKTVFTAATISKPDHTFHIERCSSLCKLL